MSINWISASRLVEAEQEYRREARYCTLRAILQYNQLSEDSDWSDPGTELDYIVRMPTVCMNASSEFLTKTGQGRQALVWCPCIFSPVEHILLECPRYTAARRKHLFASSRPPIPPPTLPEPNASPWHASFPGRDRRQAKPRAEWEPG